MKNQTFSLHLEKEKRTFPSWNESSMFSSTEAEAGVSLERWAEHPPPVSKRQEAHVAGGQWGEAGGSRQPQAGPEPCGGAPGTGRERRHCSRRTGGGGDQTGDAINATDGPDMHMGLRSIKADGPPSLLPARLGSLRRPGPLHPGYVTSPPVHQATASSPQSTLAHATAAD